MKYQIQCEFLLSVVEHSTVACKAPSLEMYMCGDSYVMC